MTTDNKAEAPAKSTSNKEDWGNAKQTGPRKFRTVENAFHKFENVDDAIEGYLVDVSTQRMRPNRDGSPNVIGKYKLQQETETGDPTFVEFLGGTDIDSKMKGVEINDYVRITLTGSERTSSGNLMKRFTVEVAE